MRPVSVPTVLSVLLLGFLAAACSPARMIERRWTPASPFEASSVPAGPDYAKPEAWAALPDRADKADFVPAGADANRQATAEVDVFFIHPTTYYSAGGWNQPLDDVRANEITDNHVLVGQATAFNGCCRVYAPRYRQATLASYFRDDASSRQAFEVAYGDVAAAFAWYLEHFNQGRPFILASHSQGSMHAMRLLEQIDASDLRTRLVAAYVIGYSLPVDKFERSYKHLRPCQGPTEVGCVVAWDTYAEDAAIRKSDQIKLWYGSTLETRDGRVTLCTNPLTWSTGEAPAEAVLNLGALPRDRSNMPPARKVLFTDGALGLNATRLEPTLPAFAGARCSGGYLRVPLLTDDRFDSLGTKGNYHTHDYGIFYMNVRQNAEARAAAFLAQQRSAAAPVR